MTRRRSNRERAKSRREGGPFVPLPISVITSSNYVSLSTKAVKLLVDMCSQLHFSAGGPINNGDISIAWTILSSRGWKSKETLRRAELELLYYEFIMQTRQGGRNRCNLYAVNWWAIDECGGKLDVMATRTPSCEWKKVKSSYHHGMVQKKKSLPLKS